MSETIIKWDTFLTSLLIALVLGVFGFITNTQIGLKESMDAYSVTLNNIVVKQQVSAEKMQQVQVSLSFMKEATSDRYTRRDAMQDHSDLDERLRSIERWIDKNGGKL